MTRTTILRLWILCAVLAISSCATAARANDGKEPKGCSNRTLFGDYGALIQGTLGPNVPLRTVTMGHYDGDGNVTSLDHVVVNGQRPPEEWRQSTAAYEVYPDCRGKMTVDTPPGLPPIVVYFVIVKDGREIHGVVEGSDITFVAYKVD